MYLDQAPFGGNLEGVRAASLAYFDREPADLSLAQAALLAGLPNAPSRLRPDRHPEAARRRRDVVLQRMAAGGWITPAEQAADAEGGVILGEGPEGDMLILREGDSGYETRIYCYQGELREELSRTGSALSPETAQTICGTETFSVARQDDGSLLITADGVRTAAALRSEGGAVDG